MNRIITLGFGPGSKVVTLGYGGDRPATRIREVLRLFSRISKQLLLVSEWRKIY